MTGVEIAWKTLSRESVDEPCIIGAWMMKRSFFQKYAGVSNIYENPVETAVDAFANAGCNLNPQFIMPSPFQEHRACSPDNVPTEESNDIEEVQKNRLTAEDVRDDIDRFLEAHANRSDFDLKGAANAYAKRLIDPRKLSRDRTLYIGGFGMPSFMSGYTKWSYESYLSALLLYPDHLRSYFTALGENARQANTAIVDAVKNYDIAPFVYSGDDICFNDGPICSVELLDDLYFPALKNAIEPLNANNIDIVWHCDGNVLPIAQRLIDAGVAGFQGFQEREAHIPFEEMAKFRRSDGSKLIFFGSISVVHTFPHGTAEDVKSEIERCFDLAAAGGGFCLAPTSSILPETPLENIDTFLEYGREYGRRVLAG